MIKKISFTLLILVSRLLFSAPGGGGGDNPPPPPGGSGGVGSVGPGVPSTSPIDMYMYILLFIAFVGLFFYAKKYKTQLK